MKGLYFTDKHDHPFNEFSKPTRNGRTTLLDEHYATYDWVAQQILHHKPEFVVNLGDHVQTIGYVDAMTITCVQYGDQVVRRACKEVGASYFPMIGNHDIGNDANRTHVLPFIEGLITEAGNRDGLFFFPFYRDWEPVWHVCRPVAEQSYRAFIHLDIVGARFNFALTSKDGISPSDFPSTCQVIAGHFHHPQILAPNFNCIGSCMYKDFRDEIVSTPRGIYVDGVGQIENPCTSLYHNLHVSDDEELLKKLTEIQHKDRCHLRVTFPEDLQPFIDIYRSDFRSIRTIPLKDKKPAMVVGGQRVDHFSPAEVLAHHLAHNKPKNPNILPFRDYIDHLVKTVLGPSLKSRTRHHVKYVSLHAENFMSFEVLDVRFDDTGVIYVDGLILDQEADVSNGAGKSVIFEAVNWCYFGELVRNSNIVDGRVSVDDVVNDRVKSNCLVSITQEIDGQEFQIMRTRKHREYGNDLRIWLNGKLEAQGLEASKKYLELVTGADSTLFRHTTLLVDSLSTRFSQLTSRVRLELLEEVIQLNLYEHLYEAVHKEWQAARVELEGVETSLGRDSGILTELQSQRESLVQNLDSVIAGLRISIQAKQSELSQVLDEASKLDVDIKNRTTQMLQIEQKVQAARAQVPVFNETNYRKNVNQITTDLAIMERSLSDKIAMSNGRCPTCGKSYAPTPLLLSEIEHLKVRIQKQRDSQVAWQAWESGERVRIKQFEAAVQEHQQAYQSLLTKIQHLKSLRQPMDIRMTSLRSEIQEITRTLEATEGQISILETRINQIQLEIQSLRERVKELGLKAEVRMYWDLGLSPKGGCRMTLLQDALSQLSEYAVDYSNLISNGRVSPLIFINPKGEVGFEVTHVDGQKKYGLSSSGQRRMVDLGIQLALSRLSSRYSGFTSNLMILDEVEDKLDSSARRHLISLLEKLAEDEHKIILIASHNKDIKSYVTKTWLVTQNQGISILSVAA